MPLGIVEGMIISALLTAGSSSIQQARSRKLNARIARKNREQTERLNRQSLAQNRRLSDASRAHSGMLQEQSLAHSSKLETERLARQSSLERQKAIEARSAQLSERKTRKTVSRQAVARADQLRGRKLRTSGVKARPLEGFKSITSAVLDEGKKK